MPEHVQHVRLVLRTVRASPKVSASVVADVVPRIVASRNHVDAELVRAAQERAELDLAVASSARVGRSPGVVLGHEIADDPTLELSAHLRDLEREPADARYFLGIGSGRRTAATVLDVIQVHQAHVGGHDLVALLVQQACRDRRVHPA